jgi:mycoredoxin
MSGMTREHDPGRRRAVDAASEGQSVAITVYWRPGCIFCRPLLRWLDESGVPAERCDIWSDPEAAASLRAATGGPETVPTLVIGDVVLVNPSPRDVLRTLDERAPELLPPDVTVPPRRWWERLLP